MHAVGFVQPAVGAAACPFRQTGRGQRWAEIIALGDVATEAGQYLAGRAVFHPFGNRLEPQVVGEIDHGAHDRAGTRVLSHVLHEGPVDLEVVEWQIFEIGQRGIGSPKVVDGSVHAQGTQPTENGTRLPRVGQ